VGRVTGYSLDESGDRVTIDIFVNSPYDRFVGTNSRFWEASGVEAKLDSSGVSVRTQSLLTVALGGIAFASPIEGKGEAANEPTAFMLAASEADAMKKPDGPSRFLVLNFDQSLRGLQVGAIVDFRGVELGQVRAIDAVVDENTNEIHMPVLIEVFSDRMKRGRGLQAQGPLGAGMTQKELKEEGNRWLQNMVQRGLRAQLRTGNLLTGQLYVSLDFFPQAKPAEMRSVQGDLMELPTVGNSLDEFQQQIAEILAKINKVPFDQIGRDLQQTLAGMRRTVNAAEKTVKGLNDNLAPQLMGTIQSLKKTLDSADRTLVSANRTLASDSPTQEELQQTLRSVSTAADSLRRLTDYLERHPESLLRGKTGN
jgi:mammalian cell entry related domain protein